ncbi:hypothetical protein B0O95_101234 [Mycetohabitans endofungorum]|uniref:Uncharacterized protein n=1 Tax=Mycetohabitans endofungorum TaxID=417203 RepID=A0A2P5KEM0_9BURK|nr:hypothetical protein B0O95_101234 [Mycetohabitans endofungorum]
MTHELAERGRGIRCAAKSDLFPLKQDLIAHDRLFD